MTSIHRYMHTYNILISKSPNLLSVVALAMWPHEPFFDKSIIEVRGFEHWMSQLETPWGANWATRLLVAPWTLTKYLFNNTHTLVLQF